MARAIRVQYEEAVYHVVSRGNRRMDIYLGDRDRELFVETLAEAREKSYSATRSNQLLEKN